MLELAKFPHLHTLRLATCDYHLTHDSLFGVPADFKARFWQAIGGKLRALLLQSPGEYQPHLEALAPHLHHLSHLRVLIVIDEEISGDHLWQLPQLEFFQGGCHKFSTIQALRTMSVERVLKGASLTIRNQFHLVRVLWAEAPLTDPFDRLDPQTFTPMTQPAAFTRLTLSRIHLETSHFMALAQQLTKLQHLRLIWRPDRAVAWDARIGFPHLKTLHLFLETFLGPLDSCPQPFLPICPQATALTLTARFTLDMSRAWLIDLVKTSFPSLTHLSVRRWEPIDPITPPAAAASPHEEQKEEHPEEENGPLSGLADGCPQLESLDLEMSPSRVLDLRPLLATICRLAAFRTLEVTSLLDTDDKFVLPPELYIAIASHPAFCILRVHLAHPWCNGHPVPIHDWQPNEQKEVAPSMVDILARLPEVHRPKAEQRLARFRLYRHDKGTPVRMYALQKQPPGEPLRWTMLAEEYDGTR